MKTMQEIGSRAGHRKSPRQEWPRSLGAPPRVLARSTASAMRGTETVLLVAEDPMVQSVLARAIRQLGYCVLAVENIAEAQFQAQTGPHIDLLLLDQDLPDPRNEQLAMWFRATYPETKVLMVSGSLWELNLNLAVSQQIAMLAKPFTLLQLARMLRQVLE
jgi:two-component system cell cycle sensor histidine kinase/response regulator CckA